MNNERGNDLMSSEQLELLKAISLSSSHQLVVRHSSSKKAWKPLATRQSVFS